MQHWYIATLALTAHAAYGCSPAAPKPVPLEVVQPVSTQLPVAPIPDAAVPDAAPPPRIACEPGASIAPAAAPESTLYCVRADGQRHGPYLTLFPDGTTEITGTYKDGKLNGTWQRNHPNGGVAEQGDYVDDLKDGTWRQYGPSGTLLGEHHLSRGSGVERRWYDDGPLYLERTLKAGEAHGALRLFDRAGGPAVVGTRYGTRYDGRHVVGNKATLRLEETWGRGLRQGVRQLWSFGTTILDERYDRSGKLDGAFASWRDRKTPRIQGSYAHGKRVGKWTWFDRYNNKEREGSYRDGKKTGTWVEWLENKLVSSGNYTDDKPDGEFVYYDANGNEVGRFAIKGGTGTMVTFHANRQPATRQQLVNGLPDGVYQEFTATGRVVVEGHYRRDHKHGWWREWNELGALSLEQQWQRGKLDGVVKKYDRGKLVSEAHFKNGKAVGSYTEYRDGNVSLTGQFADDRRVGTWTSLGSERGVVLTATYHAGVLDGPWRQLTGGSVLEGNMVSGRRSGAWTRTERDGTTSVTTIRPEQL